MWEVIMGIYLFIGMVWDLLKRKIPVLYLMLGTVAALFKAAACQGIIPNTVVWGAMIGGIFLVISKCTKEQIGYGDSWMILILGIWLGIWDVIRLLAIVFMLCFAFSCVGLACKKIKRYTRIPFYPFLMLGYTGVMLW